MRRDRNILYDILNICAQGYEWSTYYPGRGYSEEEFKYHLDPICREKLIEGPNLTWKGNDVLEEIESQMYLEHKIAVWEKERHAKENLR